MSEQTQTLDTLLEASAATEDFKSAVRALEAGKTQDRIHFNTEAPPVKALRTVCKLLEERPELAVESVRIQAHSGCSDFTGRMAVQPGDETYSFSWDCRWRAEQEGWQDAVGYPDQIRAAREFGYQCFKQFEKAG